MCCRRLYLFVESVARTTLSNRRFASRPPKTRQNLQHVKESSANEHPKIAAFVLQILSKIYRARFAGLSKRADFIAAISKIRRVRLANQNRNIRFLSNLM